MYPDKNGNFDIKQDEPFGQKVQILKGKGKVLT